MSLNSRTQFRPCLAAALMDPPAHSDVPAPILGRSNGGQLRAPEPDDNLVIALADYADAAGHCHCDVGTLLMEMLARFTHCPASQLEHELKTAFWRVCEFLEIERGGLWRRSGQNADSFILTHVYPTPAR